MFLLSSREDTSILYFAAPYLPTVKLGYNFLSAFQQIPYIPNKHNVNNRLEFVFIYSNHTIYSIKKLSSVIK